MFLLVHLLFNKCIRYVSGVVQMLCQTTSFGFEAHAWQAFRDVSHLGHDR